MTRARWSPQSMWSVRRRPHRWRRRSRGPLVECLRSGDGQDGAGAGEQVGLEQRGRRSLADVVALSLQQRGGGAGGVRATGVDLGTRRVVDAQRNAQPARVLPDLRGEWAGQRGWRPVRALGRRRDRVEQPGRVAHRAGDHTLGEQADGRIGPRPGRHPAAARLQPDQAAMRGRDPDGPRDVVGVGRGDHARRDAAADPLSCHRASGPAPTGCGSRPPPTAPWCPSAPVRRCSCARGSRGRPPGTRPPARCPRRPASRGPGGRPSPRGTARRRPPRCSP